MNFDAAAIAAATSGVVVRDGPAGPIATDTRALPDGCWFVALVGPRFDGHSFVAHADRAVGCVVSTDVPFAGGVVRVVDTTAALQDLGRAARDRLAGPVVGLTGSSGKTTTRALIALALESLGAVHQTFGNLNNHLGVPLTLVAAPEDAPVCVVEMGTSGPGEILLLAQIVRPDVRLIVNIGPAHLQELGGLDGVAREKGALFDSARPGDVLVINLDDPLVAALPRPPGVRVVSFGTGLEADVRMVASEPVPGAVGQVATWVAGATTLQARLGAIGAHVALDAAAALAVAHALGVDLRTAASAVARYAPVGMRQRLEPLPRGAHAINDSYNANPQSMEASLRALASLPGRRAAVLGDMLELGADEAMWHERVAALAGELGLDLVLLVGRRMAAAAGACHGVEVWSAVDGLDRADALAAWLAPGDHVLFKGSRGARMERILQAVHERGAPCST